MHVRVFWSASMIEGVRGGCVCVHTRPTTHTMFSRLPWRKRTDFSNEDIALGFRTSESKEERMDAKKIAEALKRSPRDVEREEREFDRERGSSGLLYFRHILDAMRREYPLLVDHVRRLLVGVTHAVRGRALAGWNFVAYAEFMASVVYVQSGKEKLLMFYTLIADPDTNLIEYETVRDFRDSVPDALATSSMPNTRDEYPIDIHGYAAMFGSDDAALWAEEIAREFPQYQLKRREISVKKQGKTPMPPPPSPPQPVDQNTLSSSSSSSPSFLSPPSSSAAVLVTRDASYVT